MLNGIHLVDFGNHRDTRLTFGRMTALVGQNGSGKTTVMRAVGEVRRAMIEQHNWHPRPELRRRYSKDMIVAAGWSVEANSLHKAGVRLLDEAEWYQCECPYPQSWIPTPTLSLSIPGGEIFTSPAANWKCRVESKEGIIQRRHNPAQPWKCRYFKTSARSLQVPAIADQEAPSINDDGSNLAWALSYLMTAEPERFAQVIAALKEVVPVVNRIRSRPTKLTRLVKQTITINRQERTFDEEREVMGQELIFDMKSGDGLPATSVSEGTLVVLAVLTLVYGSDADFIMLDDVELGLHPKAQRDLIRQLRRIQETHPKLQILVSTHSPYVVDEFKAEDVWVFAPDKDGCAVSKRLSDHPDAKRALEVLTTGEFWSAEGEPWVLNDEEPVARVAEEPHA